MIRSPVRRHHHHRSKSPTRHEREREREREHRSSHSAKEKRSHEEENGRHHHHGRSSREHEHVKERSHREKDSSTERSRDREEVSVDRRRNSTNRGEHHENDKRERSKRNRSQSPPMDRNRSHVRPTSPVSPSRRSRSRVHDEVSSPQGDEHRNENESIAKMKAAEEALEAKKKEEPSFELSGKLAEETNRVRGVTLLFTEPPDARKPDIRWRLYVFKAGEVLNEPLYIHRQSCYLFGRERRVADVPTDHPSCSKQHAVIQFRLVEKELPDGMLSKQVRPYLMDLGSTNGTFLNENRIESQRYYELFEKDTIKFGNSSREYVMLHENSA